MLAPVRIVVPDPAWMRLPDPLMGLERVSVSLFHTIRFALLITLPLPRVPFVPPMPIWRAPPEIVVGPE